MRMGVRQSETDDAKASIDGNLPPEIRLVDRQERRLVLLVQQDWNCIIFDDGARTQIRDEEDWATIPACKGGVEVAP
jgi:hypothetical protein